MRCNQRQSIDFRKVRIETVIPFFIGVYCSLFLCSFTANKFDIYRAPVVIIEEEIEEDDFDFSFSQKEAIKDPVLDFFRNPEYTEWVTVFFSGICQNREIAQAVLSNADKFDVSPSLAFALCWEESRFNPSAINHYNLDGSIDRGLFQLNNRSFPDLNSFGFFDISTNVYYGISHLRFCLDTGGSEVSALAMYNAGTGRVRSVGAPEVTLNYISRILNNKSRVETYFHERLIREEERRLVQ